MTRFLQLRPKRFGLFIALLIFSAHAASAASCSDLVKLSIPNVTITSGTSISGGRFTLPDSSNTFETTGFCRVVAVAKPSSDSIINFEVWIPGGPRWNHDFLGVGNGGYNGAIQYARLAHGLERGFATASTDTGHTGEDLSFAAGHPQKIIDWGYRAIHIMTESAKQIIREYVGASPKHSYFMGCSTGGHQALTEVQRFPSDYDGVVAGDPGNNRVHLNVGFLWAFAATHDVKGAAILPTAKLPLINRTALTACDASDGVKDGIISDPQTCHFDPGILLCKGEENNECLTTAQVEAVRKVYAGPRNPGTGEQIIAGYSPGSESPAGDEWAGGWKSYITDRKEPMRLDFWKYWVFNNDAWDWRTFDYDRDVAYADEKLSAVNAVSTDLSAFKERGGKLLMYSGWADPVGPPMDAVSYYERVEAAMGGHQTTHSFFRLFMVPGMAHCGGGPGPNFFGGYGPSSPTSTEIKIDPEHDVLSAVVQWVERGLAPDHIIGAHFNGDHIDRTRPICPYPMTAHWNRKGNTDDAENFSCVLVGIATSNAFGQSSPPSASNPERISDTEATQQVLAVDEARRLAMLHSDVSALDSLLSDDVTIFWGDGTADDKASTLALFRSGRLRYAQLDYENTRARLYGEIAVLTGQARVKEQSDKESRSYIVRVTRVYARRQGRWRLVASQTTRVAPL